MYLEQSNSTPADALAARIDGVPTGIRIPVFSVKGRRVFVYPNLNKSFYVSLREGWEMTPDIFDTTPRGGAPLCSHSLKTIALTTVAPFATGSAGNSIFVAPEFQSPTGLPKGTLGTRSNVARSLRDEKRDLCA